MSTIKSKQIILSVLIVLTLTGLLPAKAEPNAAGLYAEADELRNNEQYAEAIQFYQQVIDTYPQNRYVLWSLQKTALCHLALGQDDNGIIERLISEFSSEKDADRAFCYLADRYYRAKQYDRAKRLYQHILDTWPESKYRAKSIFFSADSYLKEEQFEDANPLFVQLINSYPESKYLMWSLQKTALCNLNSGNIKEAYANSDRLLAGDFSSQEKADRAFCYLADRYFLSKHYGEAKRLYQYILDTWPGSEFYCKSLRLIAASNINLGNHEPAESIAEKVMAECSKEDKARYFFIMAENYQQIGSQNGDEALIALSLQLFDKVINEYPDSEVAPEASLIAADCYTRELEDYIKAIEHYQKIVDSYPNYHLAWHAQFMVGRTFERIVKEGLMPEDEGNPLVHQAYSTLLEKYPDCKAKVIAEKWLDKNSMSVQIPADSNEL